MKILILLLFVADVSFAHHNNNCEKLMHISGDSLQRFTRCAYSYSAPVTYCTACSTLYSNGMQNYTEFLNSTLETDNKTLCSKFYIDKNRLNLIPKIHEYVQNLWDAGSCSNCFYWKDGKIDTKANETIEFYNKVDNFTSCVDLHNNTVNNASEICFKCKDEYEKLNNYYNTVLKTKFGDDICYDIKDKMNITQLQWSGDFKCCKDRNTSRTAFFSISSIFTVIPVLFYVGFYFHTRRRENFEFLSTADESHVNINENGPFVRTTNEATPSTSYGDEINTSQKLSNGRNKLQKSIFDEDDSE